MLIPHIGFFIEDIAIRCYFKPSHLFQLQPIQHSLIQNSEEWVYGIPVVPMYKWDK